MELFAEIVNDWKPSAVLANSTILHIWQGSEYDVYSYHVKYAFLSESTIYTLKRRPVWLNGWVFVDELNGCGFESRSKNASAVSKRENATQVASTLKQDCWWHYIRNIIEGQVTVYSWGNFLMKHNTPYKFQKKLKNNNLIDRNK